MSGINLSKLHECESVSLRLPLSVSPEVILKYLSKLGFKTCDDFCFLPRKDKTPPWQSEHVTTVTFFHDISEVQHYFDSGDDDDEGGSPLCNHLVFDYLFATQPPAIADEFLKSLRSVHAELGGTIEHHGRISSVDEVERSFALYREDIWSELAELPGSEFLAQYIASSYPRS